MTLKMETAVYRWNCLSSDDLPDTGVTEGSTVHLVDTGECKVYHDGQWEDDLRQVYAMHKAMTM